MYFVRQRSQNSIFDIVNGRFGTYFAPKIVEAWHVSQCLEILFVTTVIVTTLSTFSVTIAMSRTFIDAGYANSVSHFSLLVVPITFGWTSLHLGTVTVPSAGFKWPRIGLWGHLRFVLPRVAKVLEASIAIKVMGLTIWVRNTHWVFCGVIYKEDSHCWGR